MCRETLQALCEPKGTAAYMRRNTPRLRPLLKELCLDCAEEAPHRESLMRLSRELFLICGLTFVVALATAEPPGQEPGGVIAVNVLLEPDQQVSARAERINGVLRESSPGGFALDASHLPHISLLHGYVQAKDLAEVYRVVEKMSVEHPLAGRQLTVAGLEHKPWNREQITNIKIEKTPELEAFQAALVAALSPYLVATGDKSAFFTSNEDSGIDEQTIEYVRTFVQKHTGSRFEPHITVGISDAETARKVTAQEGTPARLTIASVAVFQLGNVGTARKELWHYSPH